MTLKELFKYSLEKLAEAGLETPDLEAGILISFVIKKDRLFLLSHPEFIVSNADTKKIKRLLDKRIKLYPIAYLLGHKEFYGYNFLVNKNVLIPRPETEWLVEQAIENIDSRLSNIGKKDSINNQDSIINILDLGTGSGCIIISLANELCKQYSDKIIQQFDFFATDISKSALKVAKKNASLNPLLPTPIVISTHPEPTAGWIEGGEKSHHKETIRFFHSNLFSNKKLPQKFDLIIANLPYVPKVEDRNNRTTAFEPQSAIFADDNGSMLIKQFLVQAEGRHNPNSLILIELDPRNAKEIENYAKKIFIKAKIELKKDLAGHLRYLIIKT